MWVQGARTTSSGGSEGLGIHLTYPYPAYGGLGPVPGGHREQRDDIANPGNMPCYQCGIRVNVLIKEVNMDSLRTKLERLDKLLTDKLLLPVCVLLWLSHRTQ